MSFNWQDYLLAAKMNELAVDSATAEAFYRASMSRSYYAMYHRAADYTWDTYGFRVPVERGQAAIAELEINGHGPDERSAGRILRRMRERRVTSDYEGSFSGGKLPAVQAALQLSDASLLNRNFDHL